jgi:hypothetical protein
MSAASTTAPRCLFRLTRPVFLEKDLHQAAVNALDVLLLPPAAFTTMPIGHIKLDGQQASKFARLRVRRGWPDVLVVFDGRCIGIELKRRGGALSRSRMVPTRRGGRRLVEGQAETHAQLRAAGMTIAVCDSVDAVLDALRAAGVPLRAHQVAA